MKNQTENSYKSCTILSNLTTYKISPVTVQNLWNVCMNNKVQELPILILVLTCFHWNEYTFMFFCHFSKGNNFCDFLFAFQDKEAL